MGKELKMSSHDLAHSGCLTVTSSRPTTAGSSGTSCSEESTKTAEAHVKSVQPDAKTSTSVVLPPKVPKRPPAAKTKLPLLAPQQAEKEEIVAQEGAKCGPQSLLGSDK